MVLLIIMKVTTKETYAHTQAHSFPLCVVAYTDPQTHTHKEAHIFPFFVVAYTDLQAKETPRFTYFLPDPSEKVLYLHPHL